MYCNFALSVSILLFILLSLIYLLVVQRFSGIDSFMRNPFDENVFDGQFFLQILTFFLQIKPNHDIVTIVQHLGIH